MLTKQDLAAIKALFKGDFKRIDDRFTRIDDRFTKIDERFTKIDNKFTEMDDKFKQIDDRFNEIDQQLEKLDQKIDKKIDSLRTELITQMNENTDELVKLYESDNGVADLTVRVDKLERAVFV